MKQGNECPMHKEQRGHVYHKTLITMRKRLLKFNVDKLKVCYKQPQNVLDNLARQNRDAVVPFGEDTGYNLHIKENFRTEITADVQQAGKSLGTFQFNGAGRYENLCFLDASNKTLYGDECLPFLTEVGEQFETNSITQVDVAADVNVNATFRIRRYIQDIKNFDMILNGKVITDPTERLDNYGEWKGRSRGKIDRIPTLYIKQAGSGLKLRAYDKQKEIEDESNKTYITTANGFSGHRVEVCIKWEQFQKWLNHINKSKFSETQWKRQDDETEKKYIGRSVLLLFGDEAYRRALWCYCTHRLLYFRIRGERKTVSMYDLIAAK